MDSLIQSVVISDLKKISNPKGDLYHALKSSDPTFSRFGEAYFTSVNCNEIKGWKRHREMNMNLIVPVGMARFYLHDDILKKTESYIIGVHNYKRLYVPCGLWMSFEGLSEGLNLILNIADILHNPAESDATPLESFPLR